MNVVLAVRQAHTRLSLELVLCEEPGVTVVGMASETEGVLALTRTARPDLVVLEWGLPGRPTAALVADIRVASSPIQFLVLARDPTLPQRALTAGTYTLVVVGDPPDHLLTAVRQIRASLRV